MSAKSCFVLTFLLILSSACARGAEVQVAVAANFSEPMRRIAELFEAASGHRARLSFGASGMFHAQIRAGAPFDVLLSADRVSAAGTHDGSRQGLARSVRAG